MASVSKLKKTMDKVFHELRTHEIKIVDVAGKEADDMMRVHAELEGHKAAYDEIDKKITRLEALSEVVE